MSVQTIQKEVEKLNKEELFFLMRYILNLMEEDNFSLSEAWKGELDYRDEQYKNGKESLKSWAEVKKQILSK